MAVYLALPNVLFRPTLEALAEADLPAHTTLVVEKPFGTDLDDAKALNALIARSFDERDVFRIDHFVAKQTVLDVLGLRSPTGSSSRCGTVSTSAGSTSPGTSRGAGGSATTTTAREHCAT
jgi:glucose-6-phosphate 1-dehydrogenase